MSNCIGPTYTACALIALIFIITNYYIGYHDKTCVNNELLSIKIHQNETCTTSNGCVTFQTYLYVQASILVLVILLFVLQNLFCGDVFRTINLFIITMSTVWSIVGAYLLANTPLYLCKLSVKWFLGISVASTLGLFPLIIVTSLVLFNFSPCKKAKTYDV